MMVNAEWTLKNLLNNFVLESLMILIGLILVHFFKLGFATLSLVLVYIWVRLWLYEKMIFHIEALIKTKIEAKNESIKRMDVNERQRRRIILAETKGLREKQDYWEKKRRYFIDKVPLLGMVAK